MENKAFAKAGIDLQWKDYPGGTGAMMQDLREDRLDLAVALTEGVVAEIANHQSCLILQWFVTSPLIWGIHVGAQTAFQEVGQLEGKRFAISRMGSGSHLMAYVNARQQGWHPRELTLVPVGNLEGARNALLTGKADGFMWEKFMTKPFVDQGEFRRIGECPTPWPCFVIAVHKAALSEKAHALPRLMDLINTANQAFMNDPQASRKVAKKFNLPEEDAEAWFRQTEWATHQEISGRMLEEVVNTLHELGSIEKKPTPSQLCSKF
jgi:ABC-type nitrate/sulfonate/bicarbonate transport system substrate-binding protein